MQENRPQSSPLHCMFLLKEKAMDCMFTTRSRPAAKLQRGKERPNDWTREEELHAKPLDAKTRSREERVSLSYLQFIHQTPRSPTRPPSAKSLNTTPTSSATQDIQPATMQSLRSLHAPRAFARAFSTTTPRALARMQLIGRLADQPELAPTSTGREISRFAIGVSTGPKDVDGNRSTSWFNIGSFVEGPQRDLLLSLPKG